MKKTKNMENKAGQKITEAEREAGKDEKAGQAKESKPETKPGKMAKPVKIAVASALSLCLVASLGLNIFQASQSSAQNKRVNKFIDNQLERQAKEEEKENNYQEDGFVVAESYEIRSTKKISDAYLSGDSSKLSDEDKQTLKMASDILDKVTKDDMSNYEKELAVYEWMCDNIGHGDSSVVSMPNSDSESFTPHDVLQGKSAVCVGYATTFRLFMNMLGMDVHIVHNDYHSWDLVELEKDQWYQVDVYYDVNGCKYRHFNMTDSVAKMDHEWEGSSLPEAKDVKYTYAVQAAQDIKDIYAVPKKVKKILKKKGGSMYLQFEEKIDEEKMPVVDYLVMQLNNAIMMLGNGESYTLSGAWYPDGNDGFILGIFLTNDEEENSSFDTKSKEAKKLNKLISKIFGVELADGRSMADDTDMMVETTVAETEVAV